MIIVPLPEMAGPRQRLAAAVRYALVDMAYSELPDDVEIVENEQGMFEWRSSDRGSRVGRPQPTPELARLACLTSLNVRAAMERVHVALKGGKYIHPPTCYTREQYERACALLGVVRLPDSVCESYDAWFKAPGHDAETIVVGLLASERHAGMVAEERRQRQHFERDLELLPGFRSHGLSREQYEKTCSWIGADPAPEEQIMELKIKYFEQVEIADMVDLPLVLANWRATGIYRELDEGS